MANLSLVTKSAENQNIESKYRDDLIIEAYDNRSSLIREADLIFWRSFYYERLSD